MKPYIISHMMESVDGRIDCDMTEQIDPSNAYYEALNSLDYPSQLMGRVTMQMHYADPEPFVAVDKTPIGHEDFHVSSSATGYTVALDTYGTLCWSQSEYDNHPLLVITSEACPKEYLDYLTAKHISWIAIGSERIDLRKAMDWLYNKFDVKRLAITWPSVLWCSQAPDFAGFHSVVIGMK